MQPLTPQEHAKLLARPGVTDALIDEYLELMAKQVTVDPTGEIGQWEKDAKLRGELFYLLYGEPKYEVI